MLVLGVDQSPLTASFSRKSLLWQMFPAVALLFWGQTSLKQLTTVTPHHSGLASRG